MLYRTTLIVLLVGMVALLSVSVARNQSTLAHQEKCAEAAEKFFFKRGYKSIYAIAYYQCHYSKKLDKCFILVTRSSTLVQNGEGSKLTTSVFDVFAGKCYGSFDSSKGNNVEIEEGWVGDKTCHSGKEFLTLIKPYMEE
jgi:hypothetical protein